MDPGPGHPPPLQFDPPEPPWETITDRQTTDYS